MECMELYGGLHVIDYVWNRLGYANEPENSHYVTYKLTSFMKQGYLSWELSLPWSAFSVSISVAATFAEFFVLIHNSLEPL